MKKLKNILKKARSLIKKEYGIYDYTYELIRYVNNRYQKYYNFKDKYSLINRGKNKEKLLIILAQNRDFIWEYVFPRIYSNLEEEIDVIIVNPSGKHSEVLNKFAENYGFSYLATKSEKTSVGLNIAIKEHPNAKWIYKIDDNIFICKQFFSNLLNTYENCEKNEIWNPGMVIPVLNVNHCTYFHFLEALNLVEEFTKNFGEIGVGSNLSKIRYDSDVAIWIWKNSLPLEAVAEKFREQNINKLDVSPFRFPISAVLFKRDLWNQMGNYSIYGIAPGIKAGLPSELGSDEESINEQILLFNIQQIIISLDTFVGYLGYPSQENSVTKFILKSNKNL